MTTEQVDRTLAAMDRVTQWDAEQVIHRFLTDGRRHGPVLDDDQATEWAAALAEALYGDAPDAPGGPRPCVPPQEPATLCTDPAPCPPPPWPLVTGAGELDDVVDDAPAGFEPADSWAPLDPAAAHEAMLRSCVPRPERWLEEHPAEALARLIHLGALEHAATAHVVDLPLGERTQEIGPILLLRSNGAPHHCGPSCRPLYRATPDVRPTTPQETPT